MLAVLLLAAALMFGGVYFWAATGLAAAVIVLGWVARTAQPRFRGTGESKVVDIALLAVLAGVLLQLIPLPSTIVRLLSPAREPFAAAVSLGEFERGFVPLTLDPGATLHAALSLFCIITTFWIARDVFARGGIRTFSTILAWGAIAIALIAFVQQASGTGMVYGFWRPRDPGSRPLGPFINRNHLGTWSIMAVCVCAGYLQWRSRGGGDSATWRARVSRWLDGRRLVLQLAIVLLATAIALGASRSALVALACAAGYVAVAAPWGRHGRRRRMSMGFLAAVAVIGMLGYGDGERLLMRMDETRATGMATRLAIWRDTVSVIGDFPVAGVGAGAFATAMRLYQTTPRTYYHNEAHNQYLQIAAEGGLLLAVPALVALVAFLALARRLFGRPDDPLRWMRVAAAGALVGVAVQSIWETGLTLPANGMLAAALAALVIQPSGSRPASLSDGSAVAGSGSR